MKSGLWVVRGSWFWCVPCCLRRWCCGARDSGVGWSRGLKVHSAATACVPVGTSQTSLPLETGGTEAADSRVWAGWEGGETPASKCSQQSPRGSDGLGRCI